jgi:hypothetical protein
MFKIITYHVTIHKCIFNKNKTFIICSIPFFDFPICVIGDQPGFTMDHLPIGESQNYSWRNVFSCINLLRILNKLTKWKHSRIMVS